MDDLPPEDATAPAPASYGGAAAGRPDYNVPPPAYGGAAAGRPDYNVPPPSYTGASNGNGAMPPPYSAAGAAPSYSAAAPSYSAAAPSYSAAAPSYSAAAPSYSAAAPSYSAAGPQPSAPTGYGGGYGATAGAGAAPAAGGYGATHPPLPGPSVTDVTCVACHRRLRPPPGAPVFACPCGQRMQAPAARPPPEAAPAYAGASGYPGAAAASPGFATLSRPVVASCPKCNSHVHAATNPCRCGGCNSVFTIDLADPLRLRSPAAPRKKNFLSYMFMGD